MKRTMMNSLMAVALVAGTALHAQSTQKVKANVPFDFHAGKTMMAAGVYKIAPLSDSAPLALNVADSQHVKISTLANGTTWKKDEGRARLVFLRYEGEYFLTQVCNGEECTQLRKERRQQEWEAKASGLGEIVTVDATVF